MEAPAGYDTTETNIIAIANRFKRITGYNYSDIANEFNVSRQHISQSFRNTSTTYLNSNKFMLITMVEKKEKELKEKLAVLESFKNEIKEYTKAGE